MVFTIPRWKSFRLGDIGDFPDGMANVLIRQGKAVEKKPRKRRKKPVADNVPEKIETV